MKIPFNIPNVLSAYRILVFPLILYFIFSDRDQLFILFLVINLITDILDGFIARKFNMATPEGAKLDSLADIGTYILAITGVIYFKHQDILNHWVVLTIFIGLYILFNLWHFIKFKRNPSFHIYSFKVVGYLQGSFIVYWFLKGFNVTFFYIVVIAGIIAIVEELIILALMKKAESNVQGLYWFLKKRQS